MEYKIEFYSFWRVGTGLGSGSKDSIVMKDDNNLPFIPGKTLKGLIRDAYKECDFKNATELFGHELSDKELSKDKIEEGKIYFGSAKLPEKEAKYLIDNPTLLDALYQNVTTTRLDSNKQNIDTALNKSEVCIPLILEAEITPINDKEITKVDIDELVKAFKMLKILGEKRYRGMGRCIVEPINNEQL